MPRLTTRDYKRPSHSSSFAKLKEFGLGVLVGAVLASTAFLIGGAHLRHRAAAAAAHSGAGAGSQESAPHAPAPAPDDTSTDSSDAGTASSSAAHAQSASTGTPAPKYDFYRMLPSFKVPVPHDDDRAQAAAAGSSSARAAPPAASGPAYLLQVGSYRSSAEADQIRARLARAGISAKVQRIVEGSKTWNRVRIGPLSDAELAKVREQLRTADIHALVIRASR